MIATAITNVGDTLIVITNFLISLLLTSGSHYYTAQLNRETAKIMQKIRKVSFWKSLRVQGVTEEENEIIPGASITDDFLAEH